MPQDGQALINHRPCPAQFVAAWGASTDRGGPPHGKVHRYHQFPVPNDHHQEEPINAREHPMLLTAPPAPDSTQLLALLVEDRVLRGPGPLPATAGRLTFALHMTPSGYQNLPSKAPQTLQPGAFGQSPQQAGGPVFVPTPHPTSLRGRAAAKERGAQDPDDCTQELLLALYTAFDFAHQGVG
jgi:hypothetical protein